jgi:hypothetical protein
VGRGSISRGTFGSWACSSVFGNATAAVLPDLKPRLALVSTTQPGMKSASDGGRRSRSCGRFATADFFNAGWGFTFAGAPISWSACRTSGFGARALRRQNVRRARKLSGASGPRRNSATRSATRTECRFKTNVFPRSARDHVWPPCSLLKHAVGQGIGESARPVRPSAMAPLPNSLGSRSTGRRTESHNSPKSISFGRRVNPRVL